MVAFSQVKPNTIKLRALPVFPSRVNGGTAIAVTRSHGVTNLAIDFTDLERDDTLALGELDSLYVAAWNGDEETFRLYLGSNLRGEQGVPGPANASDYETRTLAVAATISAAVHYLRTAGYATAGDGGGALYVHASGSTGGGFQSFDGQWWKIKGDAFDIRAFGAVPSDNTKGTVNAAAIVAGLGTGIKLMCSDKSLTFYTNPIYFPSTAVALENVSLAAVGAYGAFEGVLNLNSTVSCTIRNNSISVNKTAYPFASQVAGINITSCVDTTVEGNTISGASYPIRFISCETTQIIRNHITSYLGRGIASAISNNQSLILGNTVAGGTSTSDHAYSLDGAHQFIRIEANTAFGSNGWSFHLLDAYNFTIIGNQSIGSRNEGINGQRLISGVISGNVLMFDAASRDIGISFDGVQFTNISGNTIYASCAYGIYLTDGPPAGPTFLSVHNTIANNLIVSPAHVAVTGAASSGRSNGAAGFYIRLTVASTDRWVTGDGRKVFGIVGTTEANDLWFIEVIDATHIDLITKVIGGAPSAFVNAYVSGGKVGYDDWSGVAFVSNGGGNTVMNNTCDDLNGTMKYFVYELVAGASNTFIGNAGSAPLDRPIYSLAPGNKIQDDAGTTVAKLPAAAANGSSIYVTDGTPGSSPLTAAGTGTWAKRLNGAWRACP